MGQAMRQTRQYLSGKPVPDGAPMKCRAGFHEPGGPGSIGTMGFTCKRCKGFYGHDRDYSHLASAGDALIAEGRAGDALAMVREGVQRGQSR